MNARLFFICFLFSSATALEPLIPPVSLIPRELLFGNPQKTHPTLSPDGTKLAYVAPYNGVLNVWVKSLDRDDDRVVTNNTSRGIHHYSWTYDNQSILYMYDSNGKENHQIYRCNLQTNIVTCLTPYENVQARISDYRKEFPDRLLIEMNKDNPAYFDVYELNLKTSACTLIFKNPGDVVESFADHDMAIRGITKPLSDGGYEVLVRNKVAEPWHQVLTWGLDENTSTHIIGFNKDGTHLLMLDSRTTNANQLISLNIATKEREIIFANAEQQNDISNAWFHPNNGSIISIDVAAERTKTTILDPAFADDFKVLQTIEPGDFSIVSSDLAVTKMIVVYYKDISPSHFYVYDRATKKATFLFTTQPELEQYNLCPMEPITIAARDGFPLHGYISYPALARKHMLPLVLFVHGGPWARDHWGINPVVQLLTNRGYACLQLNFRGSTGYGKTFLNAGNKEWGRAMHNDLIDGITWAINTGVADPKHIAIMGGSYGGYASLCGAAFTPDAFCCAVDLFGVSNLITLITNKPAYWKHIEATFKKRIGDLVADEALLKERSPLFSAHNIKCPMLVVQGANDVRCTMAESQHIVAALKARNIDCTYLVFENEGHGLAKPENRLTMYAAIEKFLAKQLGGRMQE